MRINHSLSASDGITRKLKLLAREKEAVRRTLVVTAKKLSLKARQLAKTAREKENVRNKLVVTAGEKEDVRRTLAVTAKKLRLKARQLAVTAREKEDVRRKLVVTAQELRIKARQLAAIAKEKEVVRRTLVVTARKLKLSHETLENKVLERTKDLELLRAKDEAILASIGDGLVATDKHKRILLVNKAFERLLGWKEREVKGKLLAKVTPVMDATGRIIRESKLPATKSFQERLTTMYYRRKDGTRFPVAVTVAPIYIGKELSGTVNIFRDITKETEIEKARSEFMSIASHQLRTPLTAIRWVLSSLKREELLEEQSRLVRTAHETSVNMAMTIRRMLMISHLEEDGMEPEITQVELTAVLHKIFRLHDAHRLRNGLELSVECPLDLLMRTDEQLLIEILDNLLSNAIKYTPKGGTVSVRASREEQAIRIDVADTGFGIPQKEQQRIPEKFFRASNIASPAEAGTGIGLYMVYNMVRLIGGKIFFSSRENKGTTFTLLFPSSL